MQIQRRAMMIGLSRVAGIASLGSVGLMAAKPSPAHGSASPTIAADAADTSQPVSGPSALVNALSSGRSALTAHATALTGALDV
jgi:hypothetical protein